MHFTTIIIRTADHIHEKFPRISSGDNDSNLAKPLSTSPQMSTGMNASTPNALIKYDMIHTHQLLT